MPQVSAGSRSKAGSWATSSATRASMQANRRRDTKPELAVRSYVHALGLRYRVDVRPVPSLRRTADLVFARIKIAVFVDGCFWHGCPAHYKPPASNSDYWTAKISGNRNRDCETDNLLRQEGWTVVRVWEHDDPRLSAKRIAGIVERKRRA
ncbi:very short patch repair endonuclease [Amycolatopsis sp. NEAU-NG30]|uniref:Very short patch repair endonuclease n=1 Tax=Amycolatopsis melonis TaxID=3156488 RepID=A0ABV0LAR2_9PSEU